MSVTGTGLAKFEQGMALEAEGYSGSEIARRLGYKDAQSWWTSKAAYIRRAKAFAERCQPTSDNSVQAAAILEGLPERIVVATTNQTMDAKSTNLNVEAVSLANSVQLLAAHEQAEQTKQKRKSGRPKGQTKPQAKKGAPAASRPKRTSADVKGKLDAYYIPAPTLQDVQDPLPWEGKDRTRTLQRVSADYRGGFGRYSLHGDKVVLDIPQPDGSLLCFSLDQTGVKALATELFDLIALMEVS